MIHLQKEAFKKHEYIGHIRIEENMLRKPPSETYTTQKNKAKRMDEK
jgi:hypothetical protein